MGRVELIIVKGEVADCIEVLKNMDTESASTHTLTPRQDVKTEAPQESKPESPLKVEQSEGREALKESVGVKTKKKRSRKKKAEAAPQPEPQEQDVTPQAAPQPEPKKENEAPQEQASGMSESEFMNKMRELYVQNKDKHTVAGQSNGTKTVNKAMMTVIKEEGGYNSLAEVPKDKYENVYKKCAYVLENM